MIRQLLHSAFCNSEYHHAPETQNLWPWMNNLYSVPGWVLIYLVSFDGVYERVLVRSARFSSYRRQSSSSTTQHTFLLNVSVNKATICQEWRHELDQVRNEKCGNKTELLMIRLKFKLTWYSGNCLRRMNLLICNLIPCRVCIRKVQNTQKTIWSVTKGYDEKIWNWNLRENWNILTNILVPEIRYVKK